MTIQYSLMSLILLLSFSMQAGEPIKLTSDILQFIDGKSFGIDGDTMFPLFRIRGDLRKRLLGAGLNADEEKACLFQGKHYTIKEMAIVEQKMNEKGEMQGDTYIELAKSLSEAKISMLTEIAIPVLNRLRSGKKYMLTLIKESCDKHHRTNSLLLEWGDIDEAHEIECFVNRLDSYKSFGLFCLDIVHLIGDIIHSCPVAYQQFEEMKAAYYAEEITTKNLAQKPQ